MRNVSSDMRLRKKSIFLVVDLVEEQLQSNLSLVALQAEKECLKGVVDLIVVPNLDTKEMVYSPIVPYLRFSEYSIFCLTF